MRQLEVGGCRFISTTGGILGLYLTHIREQTDLLALVTPLQMIGYASLTISPEKKICILNDLTIEQNVEIIEQIITDDTVLNRIVLSDKSLLNYTDCHNQQLEKVNIGAYIWDYPDYCRNVVSDYQCPVYDMRKLILLTKNAVTQRPFGGII